MKGQFLGEKGALYGVLGSGYKGLMRNVSTAIKNIGGVESSVIQKVVGFDRSGDIDNTRQKISLLVKSMRELGESLNAMMSAQSKRPTAYGQDAINGMSEQYAKLRAELTALWQTYRQFQSLDGGLMSYRNGLGAIFSLGHLRGYTGPMQSLSDEACVTRGLVPVTSKIPTDLFEGQGI